MLLAIFCSLLFFTSCDVKPKLSSISQIATTFKTGTSTFPGGLIIYGIRTDEVETATYTFADGVATPISMDRGDWTFYALGYSGDYDNDGDYTPLLSEDGKFTGAISCGTASASFRSGKSAEVNFDISAEGCSGKLARTLKFKIIQTRACAADYNYSKISNTFSYPIGFNPVSTCDVPLDQEADVSFYKVTALNVENGIAEKTFSSRCYQLQIGANLELPTGEIPLNVSYYKSQALCDSTLPAHNEYNLVNGLVAGVPSDFDHRLDIVTAAISRLNLPVAHTKRFHTPFMNNIPRFLCEGNNDCFKLPVLTYMAEVPWTEPLKNQLLMKDVPHTSCSALKYNSRFFSIKDCEVRNRSVYGTVTRNALTCSDSATVHPTYVDIYARNERIYLLYNDGLTSSVSVLSKGGETIRVTNVMGNATFTSVAANDAGDIFITSPTAGTKVFSQDVSGAYAVARDFPGLFGLKIEVNASGDLMYFVKNTSPNTVHTINSFDLTESPVTKVFTGTIKKMQVYKNTLHVLESVPTGDPTPFRDTLGVLSIFNINVANGELGTSTSLPGGYGFMSFHIDNSDTLNTYTHPDGPGAIFRYKQDIPGTWTLKNGFGGAALPSNSNKIIVSDEVAIGIQANSTNLYGIRWNSNGAWVSAMAADNCSESFDIKLGTNAVNFSMQTVKTPGPGQLNPPLWSAALKLAGRNKTGVVIEGSYPINQYFHETLNEESDVTTSGGKLNRAMKLLGPHGVGGMLHEYGSCNEIKNFLDVSPIPITKSFSVNNPYSGLRSFQIQVSKTTESFNPFNCTEGSLTPDPACPNKYDLLINVASTGLLEKEKYNIKINCTIDAGELDYLKYGANETRKEFSLWNTNNSAAARVDSYKVVKRRGYFKGEMSIVSKYDTHLLWGREVMIEKKNDTYLRETEYARQGTYHMYGENEIIGDPTLSPDPVRDNDSISNPPICIDFNETNINIATSAPGPSCVISTQFSLNSKNLPLTLREMEDADNSSSSFQDVFKIQP